MGGIGLLILGAELRREYGHVVTSVVALLVISGGSLFNIGRRHARKRRESTASGEEEA